MVEFGFIQDLSKMMTKKTKNVWIRYCTLYLSHRSFSYVLTIFAFATKVNLYTSVSQPKLLRDTYFEKGRA